VRNNRKSSSGRLHLHIPRKSKHKSFVVKDLAGLEVSAIVDHQIQKINDRQIRWRA
jgi:hypothetical protein